MKKIKILLLLMFFSSFLSAGEEIKPENIDTLLSFPDKLEYGEYKIIRACSSVSDGYYLLCKYEISKNNVKLASFPASGSSWDEGIPVGDGKSLSHADFLKAGFVKLLPKNTRKDKTALMRSAPPSELVFMGFSGGAHCCWTYNIYSIEPEFKKIFNSEEWLAGYGVSFADLDKDGASELIQTSLKYDYAFDRPHSDSVFPLIVFAYDESAKKYLPANRKFKKYILDELKEVTLSEIDNEKESNISPVVKYVLAYMYLGMDKEAREVYDKYYKLKNKAALKKEIEKAVSEDPVYIFLSKK